MASEKIVFSNQRNEPLAALIDWPADRRPLATAVFAHCFTCTKDSRAAVHISRTLARKGIAVLRFDFTGLGSSEGEFSDTTFSSNVDDLVSAADALAEKIMPPSILIGHSLGGTAVLRAATAIDTVAAVVTIAAPADPAHVLKQIGDKREEIESAGEATVDIGGRPFRIGKQFIDDLRHQNIEETIGELKKPLLVMHSPVDDIVSIDHASRIFVAARHPKSFISLDTAKHLLLDRDDAVYAGNMAAAWVERFIDLSKSDPDVRHPENRVVARVEQGYRTEIVANGHILTADEPVAAGGTNTGPSPYDLLVAGLGACTAMTLRMYADHKELPLDAVTVTLRHDKVHARDCDGCETKEGRIDRIERHISLDGDLTGDQRKRMLEIADRCPVHRTLHGEVKVVSGPVD